MFDAFRWTKEHEVPERMPDVIKLRQAGATNVIVDNYDEETGRMTLVIDFPKNQRDNNKLWVHLANCDHDGVKLTGEVIKGEFRIPLTIKMLILGPEEYIAKQAQGPYYTGGPTEW